MNKTLFIILFLVSCGTRKENKPNIFTLREMSDLATVEYTVSKIIKANDNKTWFKIGDRRILMSCEAHIKAGIDMSTINEKNFKIDEEQQSIEVTLPEPKVISISISAESIKTEYEEVGVFRDKFKSKDRDALAAQAETQIKNSIDSLGVLNQAKANTSLFVHNFLQNLGYQTIHINYDKQAGLNPMQ